MTVSARKNSFLPCLIIRLHAHTRCRSIVDTIVRDSFCQYKFLYKGKSNRLSTYIPFQCDEFMVNPSGKNFPTPLAFDALNMTNEIDNKLAAF